MENVAVIGASPKPDRYSYKAMKLLEEHGHNPIPVAPAYKDILGKSVVSELTDIKMSLDTVTMYVGPARQSDILRQIVAVKPKRVIFNPGTENPDGYEMLKKAGIKVVEACTLVLLNTDQY